jgi:hypothetical protein
VSVHVINESLVFFTSQVAGRIFNSGLLKGKGSGLESRSNRLHLEIFAEQDVLKLRQLYPGSLCVLQVQKAG